MGTPFDVAAWRAGPQPSKRLGLFPVNHDLVSHGEYPVADPAKIVAGCANIRSAVSNQAQVSEPHWHAVVGVGRFCNDGDEVVHEWSREYPGYDFKETQKKIDNWKGTGATLCTTLEQHNPQACARCQHRGKIRSPVSLGHPNEPEVASVEPMLCVEAGLLALSKLPPPKRLWTIDQLIPLGKYAILAGLGGVSKTMLAMLWAVHVVLGKSWAGLQVMGGSALMLLGEEERDEVLARVGAICRHMTEAERHQVASRLLVFPWAGKDMRVTALADGNPVETSLASGIIKVAGVHAEHCGETVRLIVIDHARLAIGGDPNDAQHVTEVTRVMTKIASATGAAVVLIAHSPKSAIGKSKNGADADTADIAGSIAWVDNSRSAMVLTTMRDDETKQYGIEMADSHHYAKLQVVKANYARTGWECWLRRDTVPKWEVSELQCVTLVPPVQTKSDAGLDARIIELITAMPGQLSFSKVRNLYAGKTKRLAASEGDVEQALNKLLADGRVISRAPTADERATFGLNHNTKTVLEVRK